MGDYDVAKSVLSRIAEMRWMQLAIKPAKPFAFGLLKSTTGREIPVFGLPGNPVSSLVSFELLARPTLRMMAGHAPADWDRATILAIADSALPRSPDGKVHYQRVIAKFKEEDRVITNTPLSPGQGVLFLTVEGGDGVEFYQQAVLELKGTEDSVLTLNQEYFSRGQSKKQAQENIKKIAYSYTVKDSVITFERGFDMKTLGAFRDQKLNLTLAIPYNKPFVMDDSLLEILENTLYKNGYDWEDVRPEAIWVFNEAGLTCLTCPEKKGERRDWDSFESEKAQLDSITKIQQDSLSRAKLKDAYFLKEN